MKIEQAREILALDIERDYEDCFAKGVLIISKYAKGKWNYNFEHDQMWFGNFEETVKQMTEEEIRELATYGWFESEDSWSLFS